MSDSKGLAELITIGIVVLAWGFGGWVALPGHGVHRWDVMVASRQLWTTETFWVPPGQTGSLYQTEAMLINVSSSVHWYIEVALIDAGTNYSSDQMTNITTTFELTILPRLHSAFGSEPLPPGDVDGDSRSAVLITTRVSLFSFSNLLPRSSEPYSNEREMIYVAYQDDIARFLGTAAHEFTHLIQWNYDSEEVGWVNEGLAQEALYVVGYGDSTADDYLRDTTIGLLSETYHGRASYGAWELFVHYLAEHFGGWNLTRRLTQSPLHGIAGVEEALRSLGYETDFRAVFKSWGVANFVNDPTFAGGDYGYFSVSATASATHSLPRDGTSVDVSVENGGIAYLAIPADVLRTRIVVDLWNLSRQAFADILVLLIIRENDTLRLVEPHVDAPSLPLDLDAGEGNPTMTLMLGYANRSGDMSGIPYVVFSIQEAQPSVQMPNFEMLLYLTVGTLAFTAVFGVFLWKTMRRSTKSGIETRRNTGWSTHFLRKRK